MTPWRRYVGLLTDYPDLFQNDSKGGIRIITDANVIVADQGSETSVGSSENLSNLPGEPVGIGVLLEDPWVWVVRDWVEFPSGRRAGYLRVVHRTQRTGGHGVAILPVWNERILLIRQYRHALRRWMWEIPRGFAQPEISAEDNVRKELWEETGRTASAVEQLGSFYPDSGIQDGLVHLFLARLERDLATKLQVGEAEEAIDRAEFFTNSAVEEMVGSGQLTDSFTIVAFARARARGLL